MRNIIISLAILFFAGCSDSTSSIPCRHQIHAGMTLNQVFDLYGFDSNDLSRYTAFEVVAEEDSGQCKTTTYRHWFYDTKDKVKGAATLVVSKTPYLLTFQSCRLPNYEAIEAERLRRIDEIKTATANDPNLQQTFETFCKDAKIESQTDKDMLYELLAGGVYENQPLPPAHTEVKLVAIAKDEVAIRHQQSMRSAKKARNQLRQIQQEQEQMRMQQFHRDAMNNFYRLPK